MLNMKKSIIPPLSQSLSIFLENSNPIDQRLCWDLFTSAIGHQTLCSPIRSTSLCTELQGTVSPEFRSIVDAASACQGVSFRLLYLATDSTALLEGRE